MKIFTLLLSLLIATTVSAEGMKHRGPWARQAVVKRLKAQGLSTDVTVRWTGDSRSHKSSQFLVQNNGRHDLIKTVNVRKRTRTAYMSTKTRAVPPATIKDAAHQIGGHVGALTNDGNYTITGSWPMTVNSRSGAVTLHK